MKNIEEDKRNTTFTIGRVQSTFSQVVSLHTKRGVFVLSSKEIMANFGSKEILGGGGIIDENPRNNVQ